MILLSPAAWPLKKGKILFAALRGDRYYLFTMDDDGTNPKPLTTGNDMFPSWFPDGQRICFSRSVRNDGVDSAIYLMDADGKNKRQLTDNGYYVLPDVSPDGQKIAFVGKTWLEAQIWVMNSDGSQQVQVTELKQLGNPNGLPTFEFRGLFGSPDGQKIIFSAQDRRERGIARTSLYRVSLQTQKVEQLTQGPLDMVVGGWSPDGRKVIVRRWAPQASPLLLFDVETLKATPLIAIDNRFEAHAAWSNDGKRILYSISPSRGEGRFYIVDVETQHTHQLAVFEGLVFKIAWWTEKNGQGLFLQGKLATTWGRMKQSP
jgi:TolB protein